ncbi:copper resistance protein NlpE [Hymenobacter cellulosilyticus]|uniref:Copper resistance protein NlpE n=1 Tax=Hymenobacter cellulosilyticus TaxID=2932248 RepID=A0A8T9PZB3_9BACT|nr:copper resistance protein NlpE [Hymenobacter cellulosilyticus]UOQ70085.1 copper resistance protein NlpE [Hymenobacter cellulosilyticus]
MPYELSSSAFCLTRAARRRGSAAAQAPSKGKAPVLNPSFFTSYTYLSYSIVDTETSAKPMEAKGVGGTLTLHPDGTYQKRLQLSGNGGVMNFSQDGRFTFSGDQITFSYTDSKGQARVDQGAFRYQPKARTLTLTLIGYPAGNKGIYTLRAD